MVPSGSRPGVRLLLLLLVVLAGASGSPSPRAALQDRSQDLSSQGSGGVNRADQQDKPYLILVSFDGFRADYLDRFDLPQFRRVLRRGARAQSLIPVFPTLTFPNHYSLVTGLYPERHGIVGNAFFDPERQASYSFRNTNAVTDGSWYGGEPIWVTAETQGMVAACFFWPGSEAAIKGVRPTFWNTYDASIPNAKRVETVLEWLRLPPERRPHMITLYLSDLDSASHTGPLDAPAIRAAVTSLDVALGQLLDGLDALAVRDRVYLLLTSDHGMAETSSPRVVVLDSLVDTREVQVGFTGPVASLHVNGGPEQALKVRDGINARLENGRAYLRHETPERYRYRDNPRIGDVVIVMNESWTIATSVAAKLRFWQSWGQHGWDPQLQSMRGLFVVSGPDVPENVTIPDIENIDVYPLMTELLGLQPAPKLDGRRGHIRKMIQNGARGAKALGVASTFGIP